MKQHVTLPLEGSRRIDGDGDGDGVLGSGTLGRANSKRGRSLAAKVAPAVVVVSIMADPVELAASAVLRLAAAAVYTREQKSLDKPEATCSKVISRNEWAKRGARSFITKK